MIIQIPLGGQIRRIEWDGKQFRPLPLNGDAAMAYCTHFGNAVARLVKDVAKVDEIVGGETKHEVLTIQQFVDRFDRILNDLKSLTPEDFQHLLPVNDDEISEVEFENESSQVETLADVCGRIIETQLDGDLDDL